MFPFPSLWVKYHYPYLCHLRENIVSRPSGIFFSYTSALSQNYAHFSLQHFEVMILQDWMSVWGNDGEGGMQSNPEDCVHRGTGHGNGRDQN